jgi:Family of unknown function (DUF6188)
VVDGCHIRELPDGGQEFVLDEPGLSFIRVDEHSRLQFGRTEVVIASPFVLELEGTVHFLDPRRHDALGPFVALYPGTVRWLWASADGEMTVEFENGNTVRVPPVLADWAWSVGGEPTTSDL